MIKLTKKAAYKSIQTLDPFIARLKLKNRSEEGTFRAICLHAVRKGKPSPYLPPNFETPVSQLKELIERLLENQYIFIKASELNQGLRDDKKYIAVTFDDGYSSVVHAVELFKSYNLSLTIFVSPYFLEKQISFWSDIMYREASEYPSKKDMVYEKLVKFREIPQKYREDFIIKNFGKKAIQYKCDSDRPMTMKELSEIHDYGNVEVGNHTMTHVAINNKNKSFIFSELVSAQDSIERAIGHRPPSIAFPFGYYDNFALEVCKSVGFEIAFTTEEKKHSLKNNKNSSLSVFGRYGNWINRIDLNKYIYKIRSGSLFSEDALRYKQNLFRSNQRRM